MNQLPYMPLYWNDLLSDNKVRVMSNEELGAYVRLLGAAWHEDIPGTLFADDDGLARLAGAELSLWKKLSRWILPCFVLNDETGRYESPMLIREYQKFAASYGGRRLTKLPRSRPHIPSPIRRRVMATGRCVTCGTNKRLELDHIHPRSCGGKDEESNFQVLCKTCNCRKGAHI